MKPDIWRKTYDVISRAKLNVVTFGVELSVDRYDLQFTLKTDSSMFCPFLWSVATENLDCVLVLLEINVCDSTSPREA